MSGQELHHAACEYRDRLGWTIIPIGKDKRPMVKWTRYMQYRYCGSLPDTRPLPTGGMPGSQRSEQNVGYEVGVADTAAAHPSFGTFIDYCPRSDDESESAGLANPPSRMRNLASEAGDE